MLKIYNTLSRQKEEFKPIHAGEIGMYVCGITVYDLCHIGHGRTFVAFDVVARYLRYSGYRLNYVRNITDIDDKIIRRANENGESIETLTNRMIGEMHKDFAALGILPPDQEPRATRHIAEIIELVERLIERGHAYVADNGDVMFDVRAVASGSGAAAGGRARGSGRSEAQPDGFRAVENVESGRARLAFTLGQRPSRLAYRVLGDELQTARRALRHSRRRLGSDVPAP